MKKIAYILSFFCVLSISYSESDSLILPDKWSLPRLLDDMFNFTTEIKNKNFISIGYGLGDPYFVQDKCDEKFALIYPASIRYGFLRLNNKFRNKKQIYLASEFVGAENISSHFKPENWEKDGNTVSIWRFMGGFENGWGINMTESYLSLNHSSFLGWTHNDIELQSLDTNNNKVLRQYDNKYKFSTGFEASANYALHGSVNMRLSYSRSIIYPEVKFFQWLPGVTLELLMQRAIDIYSPNLYEKYGEWYSVANFIVKNGISWLLYELRSNNMYFPVKSDKPLNLENFSIGIGLIF